MLSSVDSTGTAMLSTDIPRVTAPSWCNSDLTRIKKQQQNTNKTAHSHIDNEIMRKKPHSHIDKE